MRIDIKTFFDMIHKLKFIMTREQKRKSIFLFVIVLIGAVLETLGVSAIMPFIEALLSPDILMQKWYGRMLNDFFIIDDSAKLVFMVAIFIIIIYLIKNLFLLFSSYCQTKFRFDFQRELSTKMLDSYMRRPYSYFLNNNSALVMRVIKEDVIGVFIIYDGIFKILAELITAAFIGIFLIYTDFIMASGVLIICTIVFIVVLGGFRKLLKGVGEKSRAAYAKANQYAYQAVNGIKEISVMRRNTFFIKKYKGAYEDVSSTEQLNYFLQACPERIIEAICISGLIGMVCIRIKLGMEVETFVPQLAIFAMAAFRILPSISRIIGYTSGVIFQRPCLDSVCNNLEETNEYSLKTEKEDLNRQDSNEVLKFNFSLEINNIYWKYQGNSRNILDGLSLSIKKGESIALIGTSGAGKTTLVDIILGLFSPLKGSVKMDGIDIFTMQDKWSKIIGYVPQAIYLIDDTIRNNIAFGVDEEDINEEAVNKAVEMAQLNKVIESLPNGLDTIVGERGVKFSGGERQRIAIARVLYYNPDILVLDEATASLDNNTEKAVMESIDLLQGYKTLIIVAHRLATIGKCDKIYEIKEGKAILRNKEDVLKENKN